jgi:diacylglycerol kinase (ATP)
LTLPLNSPAAGQKIIALVCNPTAGKGKGLLLLNEITFALRSRGFTFTAYSGNWPRHFKEFTEVWIIGGDGTLNFFINRYPEISLPIALFKGGSGNDFAWKLYGSKSTKAYLEMVLKGNITRVDAGLCNGRYFINGVGIGFDGEVVKSMGTRKFFSAGHLAYFAIVLKKIFFYREKKMSFVTGGRGWTEKIFMVSIANGSRYGGGFLVAPDADISDGDLDIILIRPIPVFRRLFYLPKVEKGKHLGLHFVEFLREKNILVSSPVPLAAHLDGELMEADKFKIEILPGKFYFCR